MSKENASRAIFSIFGVLALLLAFAWNLNIAHADTEASQISVGAGGQTIVRGAKVVSVSGSTIVATTAWGSMSLTWMVETTGSTHFYPDVGSKALLKAIRVGDSISFTGELDATAGRLTVRASVVRDTALVKSGTVLSGTVISVDASAKTIALKTSNGTTTVALNSGSVITRDGDPVRVGEIKAGENIRAFGNLNLMTKVLSADKITYSTSTGEGADTKVAVSLGFFGNLLRWLHGTGGIITIK